jgi:hypothetical protein
MCGVPYCTSASKPLAKAVEAQRVAPGAIVGDRMDTAIGILEKVGTSERIQRE